MEIVNLTPHPFKLYDSKGEEVLIEKEGCENPPRAERIEKTVGNIGTGEVNIPVNKVELGEVKNLPEHKADTVYIVPRIVAEACKDRTDLYVPDKTVRDNDGNIVGCRALAKV